MSALNSPLVFLYDLWIFLLHQLCHFQNILGVSPSFIIFFCNSPIFFDFVSKIFNNFISLNHSKFDFFSLSDVMTLSIVPPSLFLIKIEPGGIFHYVLNWYRINLTQNLFSIIKQSFKFWKDYHRYISLYRIFLLSFIHRFVHHCLELIRMFTTYITSLKCYQCLQ